MLIHTLHTFTHTYTHAYSFKLGPVLAQTIKNAHEMFVISLCHNNQAHVIFLLHFKIMGNNKVWQDAEY